MATFTTNEINEIAKERIHNLNLIIPDDKAHKLQIQEAIEQTKLFRDIIISKKPFGDD